MRLQRYMPFVSMIAYTLALSIAFAAAPVEGLKFSKEELQLLKRIDQIQSGAGIASTMLKTAPFVQLFSAPEPADVAITLATNDWDMIGAALSGLQKIQACKTVEAIDFWKEVDGNQYSNPKSEAFFTEVRAQANSKC